MRRLIAAGRRYVRLRVHHYRVTLEVVGMTLRLARAHSGIIIGFMVFALLNAVTESFTVMLMVPLLQSISATSVFTGVPLLGELGAVLEPMDPLSRLRWVAVILFGVIVMKGIVQFVVDVLVYVMPLRLERDLRMRSFSALMESTITFSDSLTAGETGNYTASFPARAGLALRFLIQFTAAILTIGMMLALLISITPSAFVGLAVFAVLGSIAFKRLTGPLSRRLDHELTSAQEKFTQAYFEAINNNRTIRLYNAGDSYLARIGEHLEQLRRNQFQTIAAQNSTFPFFSTLSGVLVCGFVLGASYYAPESAQSLLAILLVFLVAASRLLGPFSLAHISRMHFAIHADAVRKMHDFLQGAADNADVDGHTDLTTDALSIEFKDVTFTYPGSDAGVSGVSFRVEPGEFVAMIGPSGAGKSTIFHLISRLQRPIEGAIEIAGVDLNDVRARTWWSRMTVVSQDVPIFDGTVRENVLFGVDTDVDEERLREALELSACTAFVEEMPDGLDARVGRFGENLSGGQRQRIALARAFYHQSPVVLLDEVTSQLDPETEQAVARSIETLHARGHTILAIAHRPATIRSADHILVLREGRLIAYGRHDDLKEDDFYQQIVQQAV